MIAIAIDKFSLQFLCVVACCAVNSVVVVRCVMH